jgi:hypothetical protein
MRCGLVDYRLDVGQHTDKATEEQRSIDKMARRHYQTAGTYEEQGVLIRATSLFDK